MCEILNDRLMEVESRVLLIGYWESKGHGTVGKTTN